MGGAARHGRGPARGPLAVGTGPGRRAASGCSPPGPRSARSGARAPSAGSRRPTRVWSYAGVFTLALIAQGRGGLRRTAASLAAGIALVGILALLSRLHPSWFPPNEVVEFVPATASRISYPLNYWNGVAALIALGIPLLIWLGTAARPLAGRALAPRRYRRCCSRSTSPSHAAGPSSSRPGSHPDRPPPPPPATPGDDRDRRDRRADPRRPGLEPRRPSGRSLGRGGAQPGRSDAGGDARRERPGGRCAGRDLASRPGAVA